MTNLISGKEALIALANGEEVELQALGDVNWYNSTQWTVGELLCFRGRFRLKPRTITINGIECPAPILWDSLPDGTEFWIADPTRHDGEYTRYLVWDGQSCDVQHLQRGLVHLSKENAVAHAKAIILASGGKP